MRESELISKAMSLLSRKRSDSQRKGGRPRDPLAPRCACEKFTLHTAKLKRHKCPDQP